MSVKGFVGLQYVSFEGCGIFSRYVRLWVGQRYPCATIVHVVNISSKQNTHAHFAIQMQTQTTEGLKSRQTV